ncbi:MAG TPA: TlpA disulfide reductase family protein, partial [Polyangia bacterium]|nr:TlpA disulfide reductase family protein [Polyangia bacterium]
MRRVGPGVVVAVAMGFVAVRFLGGVHDTLARTRGGACTAMQPDPVPAFLKNGPTPDFQLPDAAGHTVSLSEQKGHPVLLNFWATWCPPCVDEVPSLEDLARKLDGTDLRLLA